MVAVTRDFADNLAASDPRLDDLHDLQFDGGTSRRVPPAQQVFAEHQPASRVISSQLVRGRLAAAAFRQDGER
jgi:hypothetical protein